MLLGVSSLYIEYIKLCFRNLYFAAEGAAQSKKLARRKAAIIVLEEMKKVIEAEEKEKPQQEIIFNEFNIFIHQLSHVSLFLK